MDFQKDVIEKSKQVAVLVDFYADWCMPCKMLTPILEELANEYKDKLRVVKINVDQFPEIAEQYNVRSIPNVKLFKDGNVVDEFIGLMPKDAIKLWLDKNLS